MLPNWTLFHSFIFIFLLVLLIVLILKRRNFIRVILFLFWSTLLCLLIGQIVVSPVMFFSDVGFVWTLLK